MSLMGRSHIPLAFVLLGMALGAIACGPNSHSTKSPGATTATTPALPLELPTRPPTSLVTATGTVGPSDAALLLQNRSIQLRSHRASSEAFIAFVSTRDGTEEIYRMRADGSEQIRLTHNGQSNLSPTWSPNGAQIAFMSHKVTEAGEIPPAHLYVMNWDGAELVDLTPSLDLAITSPVWSPDGRRIAFVAIAPGSTDDAFYGANIFVVDRDGANLAQITQMSPGTVGCQSPAWSPDSAQIAFVCRSMMLVGVQIANVDGTGLWGFDSLGQVSRIFWLPSGETVAFADGQCIMGAFSARYLLERGAIDFGVWPCLDADLDALNLDYYGPIEVIWSPIDDSRFIVQRGSKIQMVDIDHYALTTIDSGSSRLHWLPSWSLDGERIAYAVNDDNGAEIYTLKVKGNEITRLTYNKADDFMPAWQP